MMNIDPNEIPDDEQDFESDDPESWAEYNREHDRYAER